MKSNVLAKFDDLFKGLEDPSVDNIEKLVHESLKFFEFLRTKFESTDEKERQEAMKIAEQLQKKLEEQAQKAFKASGMTAEQLESFISNPENFSQEEWGVLEKAQNELNEYQNEIIKQINPKAAGPKLHASKKKGSKKKGGKQAWIHG